MIKCTKIHLNLGESKVLLKKKNPAVKSDSAEFGPSICKSFLVSRTISLKDKARRFIANLRKIEQLPKS